MTTIEYVDRAIALARQTGDAIATFGDMMRVPGTEGTLEKAKAVGADILVLYSPMDAVEYAKNHPDRKVIFLGVGFETTAPTVAWTLKHAKQQKLSNSFRYYCAHKLIPPAMSVLLADRDTAIDGFMCPGHVSVIIGSNAYKFITREYGIPCVIAGFEAADMARSIEMLLKQMIDKRAEVEVQYTRSVTAEGNVQAKASSLRRFRTCRCRLARTRFNSRKRLPDCH